MRKYDNISINMVKTGENIRKLRMDAGIRVIDLQRVFGFSSPQAIYKWQRGETLPNMDNMVILAMVFGVAIEDILAVDGVEDPALDPELKMTA